MSRVHTPMTEPLADYLREISLREPEVLRRLREETASMPQGMMQITPEQGQFLAMLIRLLGVRKALEVGVFTGYSSLSVALAMPPDGRIVACDISDEFTSVARRYWMEAGVADRIQLHVAPALDTLDLLIAAEGPGTFDFAFIDADKVNYNRYYERALVLLRPEGVVAVDNVLWHGRVIDPEDATPDTEAIRAFNRKLLADDRIELSVLPIGDGLTLARKR